MMDITYKIENQLDPKEFVDVLRRSTLAERRPVDDLERINKMCENADLIVTARLDGKLIGILERTRLVTSILVDVTGSH